MKNLQVKTCEGFQILKLQNMTGMKSLKSKSTF